MIKFLLMLTTFFIMIKCSRKYGTQKETTIGKKYKPSELFMKSTFIRHDPCKKFISRKSFIKYLLNNNIHCDNIWCNGDYNYIGSTNSYEVEHIIELKNSELDGCNKNIYGNILLAYGTWNRQVGNLNWGYGKQEKIRVYGRSIVEAALKNIAKCDANCVQDVPHTTHVPNIPNAPHVPNEPHWPPGSSTLHDVGDIVPIIIILSMMSLIPISICFIAICKKITTYKRSYFNDYQPTNIDEDNDSAYVL